MSLKKKILFLINPVSGVGKKNIIPKLIEQYIDSDTYEFIIKNTEYRKHGHEIALVEKHNFDIIVAIGGDGTVNEIGSALIGSKTVLGIIPTGSGNGLARHFNIPLKLKNALKTINKSNIKTIDTGLVNQHQFLGTCGFGFDAYIAKKFDEYHKRGFLSYAKLIKQEFKTYKPLTYRITRNEKSETKTSLMYCVANSSQFGNGFTISPDSDATDGKFEHVFLDGFRAKNILLMGTQFFSKRINRSQFYNSFSTSKLVQVEILNQNRSTFHIDGEPMESLNTFQIKIVPASLKIIC